MHGFFGSREKQEQLLKLLQQNTAALERVLRAHVNLQFLELDHT